jgi:thymidylate synthase (FAD)
MEIVTPYANIAECEDLPFNGVKALQKTEWIARKSHLSEDRITAISYDKFLRNVILSKGDWSVAEHVHITVDALVDRGITHEWVRHRIGAYTQESTRFVNYAKKHTKVDEYVNPAKFICPPSIEVYKENYSMAPDKNPYNIWVKGREADENEYLFYIAQGIKPQEARTCFPNALAAKLIATYNLRMWRHFFLMRTSREAHPQIRQVTVPLLLTFQEMIPILYEDIVPGNTQAENMKMMR